MADAAPGELTRVLRELRDGGDEAFGVLLRIAGPRLHALAAHEFRRSGVFGWLSQATQFVDDALLRISREARSTWLNREQFFATYRNIVRQELADTRREQRRLKRFPGEAAEPVRESSAITWPDGWTSLLVGEALDRIAARGVDGARAVRVIRLVHFEGLTQASAAARLGMTRRMIQADLGRALGWLREELGPQ
jgi:RNA polymerase sigma factor (sigma-70 family)